MLICVPCQLFYNLFHIYIYMFFLHCSVPGGGTACGPGASCTASPVQTANLINKDFVCCSEG